MIRVILTRVPASALYLNGNQISNIEPLRGLTRLDYLELYRNKISDLSPLANLNSLEVLDLGINAITDISPLAGLTHLTSIRVGNQSVSLGSLEINQPHANPVTGLDGSPVPLINSQYDAAINTFTLTGTPGPGEPRAWNSVTFFGTVPARFSGQLTFVQFEKSVDPQTPDASPSVASPRLPVTG